MSVSCSVGVSAAGLGGFAAGLGDAAGGPSAVGSLVKRQLERQPIRRRGKLAALSLDELSSRLLTALYKLKIVYSFINVCIVKFISHV